MLSKLFNKKSKEYKEFLELTNSYQKLATLTEKQEDRDVRGMTELELLDISQLLGLKLREWKQNDEFIKEFINYIKESIEKNNHSGLPASSHFIRGNEEFLLNVFKDNILLHQKIEIEGTVPKEIEKAINKFIKLKADFKSLAELRRRLQMLPKNSIEGIYHNNYDKYIENNIFTKEEIEKFLNKITKKKEEIIQLMKEQSTTPEFYQEEQIYFFEELFVKERLHPNEKITLKSFISEKNYYLSYSNDEIYSYSDVRTLMGSID